MISTAINDMSLDTVLRVIEIISIIGGGGLVAFKLGRSTEKMQASIEVQTISAKRQSDDIADLKHEIKQLGAILTKLALQEQRLDMLDKRYEELRHGDGWIQRGINGEYP
jgi:hypothetical protein